MLVDVRVFELAEHFLEDEPRLRSKTQALADHIQMSIEEWIAAALDDLDGGEG